MSRWNIQPLSLEDWMVEGQPIKIGFKLSRDQPNGSSVQLTRADIIREKIHVDWVVDGRAIPMELEEDALVIKWNSGAVGSREIFVRIREPDGAQDGPKSRIEVIPDVYVQLQARVDLGAVEAGCAPNAHCEALDFHGSSKIEGQKLRVYREYRGAQGEALPLLLMQGQNEPVPVPGPDAPIEFNYDGSPVRICGVPAGCSTVPEGTGSTLHVGPADPRFASEEERRGSTEVRAQIEPSSWWTCNLWWILTLLSVLVLGVVIHGFVSPASFPPGAALQVAAKERQLSRAPSQILREVPGGRRGFYRDARCVLDAEGYPTKPGRGGALVIRADRAGLLRLEPRGGIVERKERGRWRVVTATDAGGDPDALVESHVVASAPYRVGEAFFFRVQV
jgi:hypothetical protein